jgi:hypothetical protein
MKSKIFNLVLFLYIIIIPYYGTFNIKVKTVLFAPLVVLVLFDDFSFSKYIYRNKVIKSFALFFLFCVVTSFFSSNIELSFEQLVQYSLYFLFSFILLKYTETTGLNVIYIAFGFSLLSSIIIAYCQFIGLTSFYIYNVIDLNDNTMMHYDAFEKIRAWGPFGNSLTLSSYLSILGIVISVYFLSNKKKIDIFYSLFFFTTTFFGIIISGGRTACIAFLLCYLLAFILIKKNKSVFIAIMLIFSFFSFSDKLLDSQIFSRFLDSKNDFKEGRYDNWVKGIDIFYDNPIIGCGPGNLNTALQNHSHLRNSKVRLFAGGHVESVYVTILATYGILGTILYFIIIYSSLKLIKIKSDIIHSPYKISLLFGWIVMLLNMITNPATIIDIRLGLVLFLLLILPVIIVRKDEILLKLK